MRKTSTAGRSASDDDGRTGTNRGKAPTPAPALNTREEWQEYAGTPQSKPPKKLSASERRRLTDEERDEYDEQRITHHSSFGPIVTPAMKQALGTLRLVAETNLRRRSGARNGVVIDGAPNLGKTTLLLSFGRIWERQMRKRYPDELTECGYAFVPVVYHSIHPPATIKGVNQGLATFYALPFNSRTTKLDLTEKVQDVARKASTSLLLIDEFHFLDPRLQSDRVVNNHLKNLANRIAATPVYAGIDCLNSGLFREGRPKTDLTATQTGGRLTRIEVKPFSIADTKGLTEWIAFLKAIEKQLVLNNAPTDGLLTNPKMRTYLFERTHGVVGYVMKLIQEGALLSVWNGKETLTQTLLDEIQLTFAAEAETARRSGPKRTSQRTKRPHTRASETDERRVA